MPTASNYAVVTDGVVSNTIIWDGESGWSPPDGSIAIVIPDGAVAGIGSTYADGAFTPPAPVTSG